MIAHFHIAADFQAFAAAASTVLAAIGQRDAVRDACSQNGLIGLGCELAATGFNGDLIAHGCGEKEIKRMLAPCCGRNGVF